LRKFLACLVLSLLPSIAAAGTEIATRNLVLRFDDSGNLQYAMSCLPDCGHTDSRTRSFSGNAAVFTTRGHPDSEFSLERSNSRDRTTLTFSSPSTGESRAWTIPESGWLLQLETRGAQNAELASGTDFRPPAAAGFGEMLERVRYAWFDDSSVVSVALDDEQAAPRTSSDWFGYRNRYWAALARPAGPVQFLIRTGEVRSDAGIELDFQEHPAMSLALYLGPLEPEALKSGAPELGQLMYSGLWFPLRWICQALFFLISAIHFVIPHWAVSIMLLSLAVSILMRPLSRIADRLQDDVHKTEARLAPRLNEIRKEFKGEEQASRILALYKSEAVNPFYSLKSLAGVMVVIPVFIGAFTMLAENIWLAGESFLWIADLSRPDSVATLPFNIHFFGNQFNALPFVMTGLSVWASWLHQHEAHDAAQHRKQLQKLSLMAVAFLLLFYTFPAGMVLYWTTNNLVSVIKNYFQRHKASNSTR